MFTWMKRWLDRLGEENERLYGTGRLDCCGLNHSHARTHANPELARRMRRLAQQRREDRLEPGR